MRVLTLKQPWAFFVIRGIKKIETRSWQTDHFGPIGIHAALRCAPNSVQVYTETAHLVGKDAADWPPFSVLAQGAIIGEAEVYAYSTGDLFRPVGFAKLEESLGDYGPDRRLWWLKNPWQYSSPIPCRGRLGLWSYTFKPVPESGYEIISEEELKQTGILPDDWDAFWGGEWVNAYVLTEHVPLIEALPHIHAFRRRLPPLRPS